MIRRGRKFTLLILGMVLFQYCGTREASPFHMDPEEGIFLYKSGIQTLGPCSLYVDGISAFMNSRTFQSSDSLVSISTVKELDVITVFREASHGLMMNIQIVNPTDKALNINSVELATGFSKDKSGHSYEVAWKAGSGELWTWRYPEQDDYTRLSLDLSESSIILLPEERLLLPSLQFFSHLCAD